MAEPIFKAALVVVDMQEDFCEPHGSLAIKGARELATVINQLLEFPGFALKLATQDWHPKDHVSFASQHEATIAGTPSYTIKNPENVEETQTIGLWPDHCVQGTRGAEIIPELAAGKLDQVIQKGWDSRLESFSGFGPPFRQPSVSMTQMNEILQKAGITDLFVVGVAFDGCAKYTALDGAGFGYVTSIVEEGVNAAARSEQMRSETLSELREKGVSIVSLHSDALRLAKGE